MSGIENTPLSEEELPFGEDYDDDYDFGEVGDEDDIPFEYRSDASLTVSTWDGDVEIRLRDIIAVDFSCDLVRLDVILADGSEYSLTKQESAVLRELLDL